jgi:hypothetical protein
VNPATTGCRFDQGYCILFLKNFILPKKRHLKEWRFGYCEVFSLFSGMLRAFRILLNIFFVKQNRFELPFLIPNGLIIEMFLFYIATISFCKQ